MLLLYLSMKMFEFFVAFVDYYDVSHILGTAFTQAHFLPLCVVAGKRPDWISISSFFTLLLRCCWQVLLLTLLLFTN